MRIEFPVDLDEEISRNRARNHVFSDFWCSIEFSILLFRIPDNSGKKSGHFQIVIVNHIIFGINSLQHCWFTTQWWNDEMNKLEKKTGICSISCVILWQNSENTYFGHFLVENQDTGWKKSFCNYARVKTYTNTN